MTAPLRPIAISCGEPAGIGPEVADPRHLPHGTPFQTVTDPADAAQISGTALPVLPLDFGPAAIAGRPQPDHAEHVIDAIAQAVALVTSGAAAAVCTAPIHKKALQDGAGFAYPGHTEYLAALGGGGEVVMMLASDQLRVVPATIHIALEDVPKTLTPRRDGPR